MQKRFYLLIVLTGLTLFGCQVPNLATNSNTANSNTNSNANLSNLKSNISNQTTNTNSNNSVVSAVATREPEKYQAKITIRFETVGEKQTTSLPTIIANIARDGINHRMEFALPNNEKVIYLDAGEKHLLVTPDRKQYAELNKESLGFEVRQLMMPGQIVEQIKTMKGVEFVGEDQFNNRPVIKYRYGATTNTQTQAGQVNTESYLMVDKETGLPVRSETLSESQNGNVQGVKGLRIITEMTDIKTDAPSELFEEPKDFKKVEAEEVKAQVNLIFNALTAILGQMIKSAQPTPTASPAVSPTN
jgi:hypothetical protein